MGTISSALSMMAQTLDADQAALNIVANNVSWRQNQPINVNGVIIGTGAAQTGPKSQRDHVLEQRLNQQQQLASASGSRLAALNSVEALFTPASGSTSSLAGDIGSDITGFFNSFSSLEANPTNTSLREQVLSSASTLAGDVSNAAASLNAQRASLDQKTAAVVSQVNALFANLAQLNVEIQSASPSGDAGTLEHSKLDSAGHVSGLASGP